ncbi:MAG: hypothetical protein H6810_07235 [Phycisphaeraceae bacterium]|nr:MAG: hypothetical protein H6810_07235 [Phycisphaeraceae bacterium]
MVRALTVSMVVSLVSMAYAGDGCSTAKQSGDCQTTCTRSTEAAIQTVALEGEGCASACTKGAQPALQTVAFEAGGQGCGSACSAAEKAACLAKGEAGTCSKAGCGSAQGAAHASLVSDMPQMTYKVDSESTGCPKTAAAMAEAHGSTIHYVVADHEYASQPEAMAAHEAQLRDYMMSLVRVQYAVDGECVACPDQAKAMACESKKLQYKVGPAVFDNAEDAVRASILAWNAAQKVNMQYAVGEQVTSCSDSAGAMAEAAHCSVEYVVNGQRTMCQKTAGYMQTLARVESALKALETAQTGGA